MNTEVIMLESEVMLVEGYLSEIIRILDSGIGNGEWGKQSDLQYNSTLELG